MKCPNCATPLNPRGAVSVQRLEGRRVALCAFCESYVSPQGDERTAHLLDPCPSCGAPVAPAEMFEKGECGACTGVPRGLVAELLAEEMESRILKEALKAFPSVAAEETARYLEQVTESLATRGGCPRSMARVVPVAELGFRIVTLPGGVALAGRELLVGLEDEATLAFVLAREIAHLESGRVIRRFSKRRATWALASKIEWGIGLLTGAATPRERAEAASVREVAWLGYGAANEYQADDRALRIIARAGYDPEAAVRFLASRETRHLEACGVLAQFHDARPARSHRRCLVETLCAVLRPQAAGLRVNREVYRRGISQIALEESIPAGTAATSDYRARAGSV